METIVTKKVSIVSCRLFYNGDTRKDYTKGTRIVYALWHQECQYIHVIMSDNQRSSHSWIMLKDDKKFRKGDILKSATWRGPARNFKRGNVLTGDYKTIRWCGV